MALHRTEFIEAGKFFKVIIGESYGKPDQLKIVNKNLLEDVQVDYVVDSIKHGNKEKCNLAGQLKICHSSVELPNPKGKNVYTIEANSPKLRVTHTAFNPDGAFWSAPPEDDQQQFFDLKEVTYRVEPVEDEEELFEDID